MNKTSILKLSGKSNSKRKRIAHSDDSSLHRKPEDGRNTVERLLLAPKLNQTTE